MTIEDQVWERIKEIMPTCDCGGKTQPGNAGTQHVAVCTSCSTVTAVDADTVNDIVDQAWAEIEGEQR